MYSLRIIALALLMAAHGSAQAGSPPDPARPTAESAPVSYQSAFENYRPLREVEETPDTVWRAANDEVGKAGGHGAHTTQQEKPDAAASPAPQSMGHKEKAK